MKICFLTPEFPHLKTYSSGGIGTSIFNLSKGLTQLGNSVTIIIYGQDKDDFFIENDINFYKIKNIKVKGLSLFLTQNKVKNLINKLYVENKISIVEAPDWTGFTSFIKPKCPLILRLNGSDTYFCHLDNRPVKWFNKYLEKKAFKNADGIISVSLFTGNLTNKIFKLNRNFNVIPNAIDVNNFVPSLNFNDNTILYFGTLIRKKGLLELPLIFNEVIKSHSNAQLILIGKDSKDTISKTSSTWQLMKPLFSEKAFFNVSFLGSVPYSKIKSEIEQATVCVFPTFAEALPVSWLEAMAMQKAIVASNIGWSNEVIDNYSTGFTVHPKDHIEYAKKICELMDNKELRERFGSKAREKVIENFSVEVVAKQTLEFYNNFIKK